MQSRVVMKNILILSFVIPRYNITIILLLLRRADDLWIMIIKRDYGQHFPQPVWFGLWCLTAARTKDLLGSGYKKTTARTTDLLGSGYKKTTAKTTDLLGSGYKKTTGVHQPFYPINGLFL